MVHACHTFATRLAEAAATATEIQALLGHESLNTSQGYIDATANATRQAARANRTYRVLERITPAKKATNGPAEPHESNSPGRKALRRRSPRSRTRHGGLTKEGGG
jgi:integrase/recombinase XerD